MVAPTQQRVGTESRGIFIPETALGTPGVEGYVVPLHGRSSVGTNRNEVEVPVFKGTYDPNASVLGTIQGGGGIPITADFRFIGRVFKEFLGVLVPTGGSNYSRAGDRHRWGGGGRPGSFSWEDQFLEADAEYWLTHGLRGSAMNFQPEMEGGAWYTLETVGTGRETSPAVAPHDATPTDDPFQTVNYLDGRIQKGSTSYSDVTGFQLSIPKAVRRIGAYFNPYAAGLASGKSKPTGRLALAYKDSSFYAEAKAGTLLYLECMWGDRPIEQGFTKWIRFIFPEVRFSRGRPGSGGEDELSIDQTFTVQPSSTGVAGESIAGSIETYLIGASTNTLGVKVDGGATVSKTLTQGAARTAAQIVTDLQAAGGITGAASDRFGGDATTGGRPRITSLTKGPTSSIQIDTGVANSAHTVLGFDATVRSGMLTSYIVELVNGLSADY